MAENETRSFLYLWMLFSQVRVSVCSSVLGYGDALGGYERERERERPGSRQQGQQVLAGISKLLIWRLTPLFTLTIVGKRVAMAEQVCTGRRYTVGISELCGAHG